MEAYHSPCDKNKAVSMCCAPGDECRPDGLCLNPVRGLFRDGCTDPSWESSSCIKLCHAGLGMSIFSFDLKQLEGERKCADICCRDLRAKTGRNERGESD